jgi:hypothetical protein
VPDGMRLGWRETPARVRAAIRSWLGAEVVDARSQPGGFSPGLAARLRLADGRRVFVKAIGAERTPLGPSSYRAEARITAALPPSVPAPRLLWSQRRHAGIRPAAHLRPAPGGRRGDAGAVTAVLAAIAGFFVSASLEPAPPGLPTLRGFQLAQGRAALAWLRRRLGQDS